METLFGTSLPVFLVFTLLVMGGAAWLTGQAVAATWRPPLHLFLYCLLLVLTDRFLVWSLFGGELLSLTGFGLDAAAIGAFATVGYRITHAAKMTRQYPWLYERTGLWTYKARSAAGESDRPGEG